MRVKPAEGRGARFPKWPHRLLKATGENVPQNRYWTRRIVRGDVVMCAEPVKDKKRNAPVKGAKKEG